MDNKKSIQEYALYFACAIEEVIKNEDNVVHIKVDEDNITDVATGIVFGAAIAFNRLTGREDTYLEFTHMANMLVVQYLMQYGSISK